MLVKVKHSMGLPYMLIHWGGARGVNVGIHGVSGKVKQQPDS